jgi:hypothetical protein
MNGRSIGAMAMERQHYLSNLGKMFDAIVFLDETTATRSLAMPQLR